MVDESLNIQSASLFAKRLRRLREAMGLSQEELAHMSGLTTKAIYNYERERGPLHVPRKNNLEDLAKALNTTVVHLCPSFSFVSLTQILHERLDEEMRSVES